MKLTNKQKEAIKYVEKHLKDKKTLKVDKINIGKTCQVMRIVDDMSYEEREDILYKLNKISLEHMRIIKDLTNQYKLSKSDFKFILYIASIVETTEAYLYALTELLRVKTSSFDILKHGLMYIEECNDSKFRNMIVSEIMKSGYLTSTLADNGYDPTLVGYIRSIYCDDPPMFGKPEDFIASKLIQCDTTSKFYTFVAYKDIFNNVNVANLDAEEMKTLTRILLKQDLYKALELI